MAAGSAFDPALALLWLQLGATLFMLGLVWFVQIVHYPLFAAVGRDGFAAYAVAHQARTGWVVGPPMLLEAATATALPVFAPAGVPAALPWIGLGLLGVVWASTATQQVPRHAELADGFDATAHRRLVSSNWIRTVAWSVRGVLVVLMAALASGAAS